MRPGRSLTSSVALGLALALAAAGQTEKTNITQTTSTKHPPSTVEVGLLHGWTQVSLTVGDTLRVILPETASGNWRVSKNDSRVLGFVRSDNLGATDLSPSNQRSNNAGSQSLTFIAKATGQNHLVLETASARRHSGISMRTAKVAVTIRSMADSLRIPTVRPEGKHLAAYSGDGPCADCSGIRTRIDFYSAGPRHQEQAADRYYVRTMTYLDAPGGDTTFVEAGRWSQHRETNGDSSTVVYTLEPNGQDQAQSYLLRGGALVPLGQDGKPIHSPFNMDLKKQR